MLGATLPRPSRKSKPQNGKSNAKKQPKDKQEKNREMVDIRNVGGLSEAMDRVFKKHKITTAMKPHTTLKSLLVHPKDKTDISEMVTIVYKIPYNTCLFRNRLQEHKQEV